LKSDFPSLNDDKELEKFIGCVLLVTALVTTAVYFLVYFFT